MSAYGGRGRGRVSYGTPVVAFYRPDLVGAVPLGSVPQGAQINCRQCGGPCSCGRVAPVNRIRSPGSRYRSPSPRRNSGGCVICSAAQAIGFKPDSSRRSAANCRLREDQNFLVALKYPGNANLVLDIKRQMGDFWHDCLCSERGENCGKCSFPQMHRCENCTTKPPLHRSRECPAVRRSRSPAPSRGTSPRQSYRGTSPAPSTRYTSTRSSYRRSSFSAHSPACGYCGSSNHSTDDHKCRKCGHPGHRGRDGACPRF